MKWDKPENGTTLPAGVLQSPEGEQTQQEVASANTAKEAGRVLDTESSWGITAPFCDPVSTPTGHGEKSGHKEIRRKAHATAEANEGRWEG